MGMSVGGGSDNDLNAEINVTPLVDVMLVLLVIFMVTAPMLNSAVDLDLPEGEVTTLEDPDSKLILSIGKNKDLFLGETPVPWTELADKLTTNRRIQTERELYIEADKNLPYGVVVKAMATAKNAGVVKLMMVTDPNAASDDVTQWDAEAAAAGNKGKKRRNRN